MFRLMLTLAVCLSCSTVFAQAAASAAAGGNNGGFAPQNNNPPLSTFQLPAPSGVPVQTFQMPVQTFQAQTFSIPTVQTVQTFATPVLTQPVLLAAAPIARVGIFRRRSVAVSKAVTVTRGRRRGCASGGCGAAIPLSTGGGSSAAAASAN